MDPSWNVIHEKWVWPWIFSSPRITVNTMGENCDSWIKFHRFPFLHKHAKTSAKECIWKQQCKAKPTDAVVYVANCNKLAFISVKFPCTTYTKLALLFSCGTVWRASSMLLHQVLSKNHAYSIRHQSMSRAWDFCSSKSEK